MLPYLALRLYCMTPLSSGCCSGPFSRPLCNISYPPTLLFVHGVRSPFIASEWTPLYNITSPYRRYRHPNTSYPNVTPSIESILILVRSRMRPAHRPAPADSSFPSYPVDASPHLRSKLPSAPGRGRHLLVVRVICLLLTSGL